MTDLAARIASLEAEVDALRSASTGDQPSSRRALLRTAVVAAGAVGGAALLARPAEAADGGNLMLGAVGDANNAATTATTLTYGGPALTDRSALTVGAAPPSAVAGNNVLPGAVGGYGSGVAVANGVHGSTTVATGFGVVAANLSNFDAAGPGPVALTVISGGGHIQFVGTLGDAVLGTYQDGTLAYNGGQGLFLTVIDGLGGTRNVLLASPETASAFRILPSPVRVYDSRTGTGPASTGDGKIAGGEIRDVSLAVGFTGGTEVELFVPRPPADGVMLNLTVTETEGAGFLAVYSAALTTPPGTSNINWSDTGQNLGNLAISAIAGDTVKVEAGGGGSTHFIIDVVGVYG